MLRAFSCLLLVAAALAGCASSEPKICPDVVTVGDASELTRFTGEGRDLTDVLFQAAILDVQSICDYDEDDLLIESDIRVTVTASRGPANVEDLARFGYFVAVATADEPPRVLAREEFDVEATFRGNRTRVAYAEELVPTIPYKQGESGADYRIYVGLVMTPEELKYNRDNR